MNAAVSRKVAPPAPGQRQSFKQGYGASFQYTEPSRNAHHAQPHNAHHRTSSSSSVPQIFDQVSPRRRAAQLTGMNGYNASPDLPPPLYVRALYDYDADDQTSLSFRQGEIIQVLTQLGKFPSIPP